MERFNNALQELRAERNRAQLQVEKLDEAILMIESLNGLATSRNVIRPKRVISTASRRKMALAQKARWANVKKESKPIAAPKTSSPVKHTMSAASRRKIAAAQRARWAKIRSGQKKAA
jgi:hypothetical protein